MNIVEKYTPVVLQADSTTPLLGASSAQVFIATNPGFLTLVRADGYTALDGFPVTAGGVYWLKLRLDGGFSAITSGGADGTLGITN